MSLYNTKEAYLREAIESILAQTFSDFEFLIVNDSPQNTELDEVVQSYRDSRIKYIRNEVNLGISGARNRLLDMAEGEYIAVMDHDDIALPTRFAEQVAFLDSHPQVGVVGCNYLRLPSGKVKKLPQTDNEIKCAFFARCAILHPSAMIRKTVLDENQIRYEAEFTPSEDYALWCRLVPFTQFANLPQILFHYRSYPENTSKKQNTRMKESTQKIIRFYKEGNKALWEAAQKHIQTFFHFRLFSFFPLWSIKEYGGRRTYYLFRVIPVFSHKQPQPMTDRFPVTKLPFCRVNMKVRYVKK